MRRYVDRANVDHYLGLLHGSDLTREDRTTVTKLLIVEEDRLAGDLEHLDFVEQRTADGRERVKRLRKLRDEFAFGTTDRERAEVVLVNAENLLTLLEACCHRLREKMNSRGF
jgi:hypothetical protein